MIRIAILGVMMVAGVSLPALGATVCPPLDRSVGQAPGDLFRSATFVHMVGRFYTIEKWVTEDLGATLVDIVPIQHNGNPAFRVVYIAPDATDPTTVIVMAGGHGMELGEIEPVVE